MVHRMQEGEEAQRWKRKFLDALEEHEQRETALSNRIRLLRRGLLGVSLASDGNDATLDKQLAELRSVLRNEDRETGLELLLEQIEKSIIRLDDEKNASSWALKQAFESSLGELGQLPLPGPSRRQLKKFSRNLSARLDDPQQHAGLIRQFIELLREAVLALKAQETSNGVTPQDTAGGGLWQRLFGGSPDTAGNSPTPSAGSVEGDSHPERSDTITADTPDLEDESASQNMASSYKVSLEPDHGEAEEQLYHKVQAAPATEPETDAGENEVEGELIRDRSGLQEPAFSFIAGHVEPLLLRILESIHITGESVQLAEALRRHIVTGLNWYDFVAVLEEILQILRNAADEQRAEFEDFLSEVNESLAQVQAFVDNSRKHADAASAADAAMDARVREQVSGISEAVENPDAGIEALKESVQSQIGAIISSLDGFRHQRRQQDDGLAVEMRALIHRIGALENESRELRLHLAQQQENAHTDSLTELPNRDAYNKRLQVILDDWRRGARHERRDDDRALCLAVADVDHFKQINDTYGHLAGDKVLKIISKELVSRLRGKDFIARYGGEEFVIIMPDTRPADAEHALNKLRQSIASIPFHFKERQLKITVSFGVVDAIRQDSPESLFERADQALYKAKEAGRNTVYRAR